MPTPFGRFSLLRKIAEGGMAEVFLADEESLGSQRQLLVVKRILPGLSREPNFVRMFLNEGNVVANLHHPNIIQIYELGQVDEQYFIAMEFVHGEDLRAVVTQAGKKARRPTLPLICRVMSETLAGLHFAHTQNGSDGKPLGLVHRDVSPQNVLLTYKGGVKLIDFGIAKATRGNAEQTAAGLFKGKFAYMAPEQTRGLPIDARADIFAIGILLWELLTWTRLFKRETEMATLLAVAEDPIAPPSSVDAKIPLELDRITLKALARKPDERYLSAAEMRADLEALMQRQRWSTEPMALESYMRDLFDEKLQQQAADLEAAGVASVEEYLLSVEEKTQLSWIEGMLADDTPSPPTKSRGHGDYDDGPTQSDPLNLVRTLRGHQPLDLGEAKTMRAEAYQPPIDNQKTILSARPPELADFLPVAERATEIAAAVAPSELPTEKKPTAQPDSPTSKAPIEAQPTVLRDVASMPTSGTAMPAGKEKPLLSAQPTVVRDFAHATTASTPLPPDPPTKGVTPEPSKTRDPSRIQRVLVIIAAAMVASTIALAIALMPSRKNNADAMATLVVSLDEPAIITVDGTASPLGTSATVSVKPGQEHVVVVQKPGGKARTITVPRPRPGEKLPITVSLKQ